MVVTAMLGAACSSGGDHDDGERDVAAAGNGDGSQPQLVVVMDGWSQPLSDLPIRWEAGQSSGQLDLQPATVGDLETVGALNGQALAAVATRIYTADPSLTCVSEGCTYSGGNVDPEALLAGSGPYEPVLKAAGVKHGVYVAAVPVYSNDPVTLSYGDTTTIIDIPTAGSLAATDEAASEEELSVESRLVCDTETAKQPDGSLTAPVPPCDCVEVKSGHNTVEETVWLSDDR